MTQIGNVAAIQAMKNHFGKLQNKGLIKEWELPYEHILTRLTAAVFFITPANDSMADVIWDVLKTYDGFQYRINEDKSISDLQWRIEFNKNFSI